MMSLRGHTSALLFGISLTANWLWEMAQMVAYAPMPGIPG
jgi:hypothetical protein